MDCMVNNFDKNDWRIWNKNNLVERRTFKRAKNQLPEMECAKQLIKIVRINSLFYIKLLYV